VAPLRVPDDAVIVRSDGREFEDTVREVVSIVLAGQQRAEASGA
jgi:cytidylate kinase